MKLLSLLAFLILNCSWISAQAQIYKWTDDNGKVHYSQFKPQNKTKKTATVRLNNVGQLPDVEIKIPIKYDKVWPSAGIMLNKLELNIAGANSRDVKIGNQFSGPGCSKGKRDIMWVNGNGYLQDINSTKAIVDVFNVSGYNIDKNSSSSLKNSTSRLSLNVELNRVYINRCQDRRYGVGSKNDIYIKVHWTLIDRLTRRSIFEGGSEGIYKGMTQHSRRRGTPQAIERAFTVAARNILADASFVKHLENNDPLEHYANHLSILPLDIKYSAGDYTFKSRISQLKQASLTVRTMDGHGSGVLITADGSVLTNAHVVGDAKQVIVVVNDEDMEASVVRSDSIRDVAVLQIKDAVAATPAEIAREKPGVGDNLYVIGTPLSESLQHTVTKGIFSAERLIQGYKYYQTDATINPGNSGGPVFDESGALVAISVAGIFSKAGAGLGVNYIIPIQSALDALKIQKESNKAILVASKKNKSKKRHTDIKPLKTDKEKVFKLYQKALDAKQNGEFDRAESILKEALKNVSDDDETDETNQVRDELYFHLPVYIARDAIENRKPSVARKAIAPVKKYIKNHPKRYEYAKQVDEIIDVIKYLERALEANVKSEFTVVKIFLREYYQSNGQLPASIYELKKLLYSDMGPLIKDKYQLDSYTPARRGYVVVFEDVSKGNKITLKDNFDF